jgi:hypothetical protein
VDEAVELVGGLRHEQRHRLVGKQLVEVVAVAHRTAGLLEQVGQILAMEGIHLVENFT